MAGLVRVDGEVVSKPGKTVAQDSDVVLSKKLPFVSRGGEKMEGLLEDHAIDIQGKICLDVGASTGGFTDCLLKRGAKKVYAVDVGRGQLNWLLRDDERVVLREGVNARYLTAEIVPELCEICVIDVSFISIEKILPALYNLIARDGHIIALIKPQFEAERHLVGEKGIIKDEKVHQDVIERIRSFSESLHWETVTIAPSKLKGTKGNQEFFIVLRKC